VESLPGTAFNGASGEGGLVPDIHEDVQNTWASSFNVVWVASIVWPEVHVSIGVEVINEFNFFSSSHKEISNSSRLWLRERSSSSVVLSTWVLAVASVPRLVPINSIVSVDVDSSLLVAT